MKPLVWFALFLAILPLGAFAQVHDLHSPLIVSNDFDVLVVEGEPDENGLVYLAGIPAASGFDWPFVVYNASDETKENLRIEVTEMWEGEEIPFDESTWVYPLIIGPGEWGFSDATLHQGGNFFQGGPAGGLDAELLFKEATVEDTSASGDPYVDIVISEARINPRGGITGIVENPSAIDVDKIEIHSMCVEDSGVPIWTHTDILDRRILRAGTSADFDTSGDECDGGTFILAIARQR